MKNASVLQAARDEEIERQLAPVVSRFETRLAEQHAAASTLRYLSPAALLQNVLIDLAGTGFDRYRHFFTQADSYHQAWRDYFQPRLFANRSLTADDYDGLPVFVYREEPIDEVAARNLAPIAVLVLLGAGGLAAGVRLFARYQVEEG